MYADVPNGLDCSEVERVRFVLRAVAARSFTFIPVIMVATRQLACWDQSDRPHMRGFFATIALMSVGHLRSIMGAGLPFAKSDMGHSRPNHRGPKSTKSAMPRKRQFAVMVGIALV